VEPRTAVTVRIPLSTEAQLRRLLEQYDGDSVPDLMKRAFDALEARASEPVAAE
jgi:hypothetical protein